MTKDEILVCLVVSGFVAGILLLASAGSYMNAKSLVDADTYLQEKGFSIEEKNWYEAYGHWSYTKTVKLRYPEFIAKAKELGVTTIFKEWTEQKYDCEYWFAGEGIRYELFEKWYVPE